METRISEAAYRILDLWGHSSETSDQTIFFDMMNEFGSMNLNYGIEQALLSGKRMRTLDEITFPSPQFNCGEAGVNLLLMASALGYDAQLARVVTNGMSDHFSLLIDDGEERAIYLDAVGNVYGRAQLTSKGFVVEEEMEEGFKKSKATGEVKGYLNVDEALAHVASMNSPLGFFDYLTDGQLITKWGDSFYGVQVAVQTEGRDLELRVVLEDSSFDMVTLRRRYTGPNKFTDSYELHTDYNWVYPIDSVYTTERGLVNEFPETRRGMGLLYYLRMAGSMDGLVQSYINSRKMKKQALAELDEEDRFVINVTMEALEKEDAFKRKVQEQRYMDNLAPRELETFVDQKIIRDLVSRRMVKLTRPYTRLMDNDMARDTIDWYMDDRKRMVNRQAGRFFSSPVYRELLRQYGEAYDVAQIVQSIEVV
ncbi:hypothetical protein H6504_00065 [Candidatus Woesearchaeota archaeon]|nr:hypothetical protein [Candidatus Woesearchaeota archaeon]